MIRRLASLAALVVLTAGAHAATVDVVVADGAGNPLKDAVVMVEPESGHASVKPMTGVQIAQHDLQFDPQLTVVTTGTSVLFPNNDTVRHHVYSFSQAKAFQLKLYAGVPHAPIVFDKPGVAVLGCNIHDQMVAWVVVSDTPWFARTGAGGHARIEGVPAGNYRLHVWHASLSETAPPAIVPVVVGTADAEHRVRITPGGLAK